MNTDKRKKRKKKKKKKSPKSPKRRRSQARRAKAAERDIKERATGQSHNEASILPALSSDSSGPEEAVPDPDFSPVYALGDVEDDEDSEEEELGIPGD